MEGEVVKGKETETTVGSEPELKPLTNEAVQNAAVVTDSSPSSVPDSATERNEPAATDVKVEAEMETKAVKKLTEMETKVAANGNADPKNAEGAEEENLPSEADQVDIQPHWHAKPCVHITGLEGMVTEEDLMPLLTPYGSVVSIVFENERKDSAIVRYDLSGPKDDDDDDIVARVRETLSNTQIKDKTLMVEPFRPDSLLFIGNLTPEIDDTILRQMFEPHGTVERAFVVRNGKGRSKGYGFVEYSLKSQASAAKVAMGNINMDGRVLRVEWSDCRKVADMFSTVLFVDRIVKDCPHIEQALKNLCSEYGKVRDCHLAIGMNQQFRGFAFIDFYHSTFADKAHEALDGREVEGSNIRVSFANPSKSAQSYKSRFGSQAVQVVTTHAGRGSLPDHMMRPAMVGASMRGHMAVPLLGNRFMGQGRSNMMGMGIGMQFGRGAPVGPGMIGRSLVPPLLGAGAGMLGPGSVAAGMMGRGPGMILGNVPPRAGMPGAFGPQVSRLPAGRGPVPINSAAIAQVATAQAKAREEEAKARAEAQAKQSQAGAKQSAAEQERLEQFRKMAAQQAQLAPQPSQTYYTQQPPSTGFDQQYKQTDTPYSYQSQQQSVPPVQYQNQVAVQQISTGQQSQQSFTPHYYPQPTQQYTQAQQSQLQPQQPQQPQKQTQVQVANPQPAQQQQQQLPQQPQQPQAQQQQQIADQYSQQQAYYQPHGQQASQAVVCSQQQYSQYAQHYGHQYGQQYEPQQYNQTYVQVVQAYPQQAQQKISVHYTPQDYVDYYAQQQQPASQQAETVTIAPDALSALGVSTQTQDLSQQQQAYEAYYQQRAQEAVGHAGTTAAPTTTAAASPHQNLEAQWAAYYAAQSTLQQVGTPSGYDQQQAPYAQQQQVYGVAGSTGYYQQPTAVEVGHKRAADQIDYSTQAQASYAYPQPSTAAVSAYTQQQVVNGTTPYQQPPTAGTAVYQQPVSTVSSHQQPGSAYQQLGAGVAAYVQQTTPLPGYTLSAAGGYQQAIAPLASVYQQPVVSATAGYQQTPALAIQGYLQPNQTAASAPAYDYSKRPRF